MTFLSPQPQWCLHIGWAASWFSVWELQRSAKAESRRTNGPALKARGQGRWPCEVWSEGMRKPVPQLKQAGWQQIQIPRGVEEVHALWGGLTASGCPLMHLLVSSQRPSQTPQKHGRPMTHSHRHTKLTMAMTAHQHAKWILLGERWL